MVLFPIIIASIFLFFVMVAIYVAYVVITKIGLTICAARMRLRCFGLLWIPGVGSWFEATIVGKFWGKGLGVRLFYFCLNIITMILFVAMMSIPYEMEIQAIVRDIAYAFAILAGIIKGIIRIIAMYRGGFGLAGAICINLFIPFCWSYFMIGKVANANRSVA